MSTDPVIVTPERKGDPQQLNRYAYVRNNPLRLVDSTGETLQLSGDLDTDMNMLCGIVGKDNCDRIKFDANRNVSFDTTGIDLSKNEGANLINELVGSNNVYGLAAGTSIDTAGGLVPVLGTANIPDGFDQTHAPEFSLPPKSKVTDQIVINSTAGLADTKGRLIFAAALAFHELAEAYAKIDEGKGYNDNPDMSVVNGTRVQVGAPGALQIGAHHEARLREMTLRNQLPSFAESGVAGDEPIHQIIRDPHN
ncbi:MAG TPA: hypothetical protein VE377_10090 [Candidatus Dormibacteraeota bacterium]|nr:hypothetical protein [Candidatus Dormibacteraeota bacterium]